MQDNDLIQAVLDDWHTAPVREEIRATLGFLEKLALRPDEVAAEDIAPMRRAGVSDEGMRRR